jgi:hypothetical protein
MCARNIVGATPTIAVHENDSKNPVSVNIRGTEKRFDGASAAGPEQFKILS